MRANPQANSFKNLTDWTVNTIHANNFRFYEELNEVIQREPSEMGLNPVSKLFGGGSKGTADSKPDAPAHNRTASASGTGSGSSRSAGTAPPRWRGGVARCVAGARELARRRLEKAKASGVKSDIDEAQALVNKISRPWKAVVVGTPDGGLPFINAWVTALCPRTVFVTEALVEELDPTPDELALCIGHELGHLVCGHTEDRIYLKAMLAYAELILLAFLDPTGLLTLLGAMGFQNTAELFLAAHSRENETEADATGLTIAALACYDVRRGTHFMRKLSEATGSRPTSWWATHPATEDRYADLRRSSLGVHENVYGSHCTAAGKALQRLVTR